MSSNTVIDEKKKTNDDHEVVDEDVKIENLIISKTIGTGARNIKKQLSLCIVNHNKNMLTDFTFKENFPALSFAGMRPPCSTTP